MEFRHCSNSVLALTLASPKRHLHAAVGVDLALARGFDGQENHVLEFVDDRRLDAVGLRGRHASERLQRQHHVAQFVHGVIDVLADFEMSLSTARELVVERMRHLGQFRSAAQVDA